MTSSQPPTFHERYITSETQKWHPKLTPYRSFVLLSTIGLGSGKAIATARGLSFAATNIEWIAGVIIFSLIYVLGLLERGNPPSNQFLSWFLTHDILQNPRDEHQYRYAENLSGPIITGYRLLTMFSVTLFGVIKAYLVNRGHSPAADTVDWISGVIITSCLYVLGLYEDNPVNLMPYLFFTDSSPLLYAGSWMITYLAGISLSFLWIKTSFEMTFFPLKDLRAVYYSEPSFEYYVSSGITPPPHSLGMGLSNLTIHFVKTFFFLLCFIAGVFIFFTIFRDLLHFILTFILRISSATLTGFQLDTRLRNLSHGRMSSFVFKSIKSLTILAGCAIFFAFLFVLFLNLFLGLSLPGPISLPMLLWYLSMSPLFGFFSVFIISSFIGCVACLYFFVCIFLILCYSLAVREIPTRFDSMGCWSHLNSPLFD